MAKIAIKIEKDDIHTSLLGMNIELHVNDHLSIIFSPEALDDFINDYNGLKKYRKKDNTGYPC